MLLDQTGIEAFFLNHNDPWFEKIQEAETEDEAEGIADDQLTKGGHTYEGRDLINAIRNIRSQ